MFLKICLAVAIAIIVYVVFVPHRAPAATEYDSWRDDELTMDGVIAMGLALSDKLETEQAVQFGDLRVRSSPDGNRSVVCGWIMLPGSKSARFYGTGIGIGSRSTVPADFTVTMIGGDADTDDAIDVDCYSMGFRA